MCKRTGVWLACVGVAFLTACVPAPPAESAEQWLLEECLYRWQANGYPDDVGGVYFDAATDHYVLMLTEGADEAAYHRMLGGQYHIETATYSMNELLAVEAEITQRMLSGTESDSLWAAAVGWAVRDGEAAGFGPGGNEYRVVVSVATTVLPQYEMEFAALYGDKVFVEEGGPAAVESRVRVE